MGLQSYTEGQIRVILFWYNWCLQERCRSGHRHTYGDNHGETLGQDHHLHTKEKGCRMKQPMPALSSWTSSRKNCEEVKFCCLSHPVWGIFYGRSSTQTVCVRIWRMSFNVFHPYIAPVFLMWLESMMMMRYHSSGYIAFFLTERLPSCPQCKPLMSLKSRVYSIWWQKGKSGIWSWMCELTLDTEEDHMPMKVLVFNCWE